MYMQVKVQNYKRQTDVEQQKQEQTTYIKHFIIGKHNGVRKKEIKVEYRKQNNTQIIKVVINNTYMYIVTREYVLKLSCCAALNNDLDYTVFVRSV